MIPAPPNPGTDTDLSHQVLKVDLLQDIDEDGAVNKTNRIIVSFCACLGALTLCLPAAAQEAPKEPKDTAGSQEEPPAWVPSPPPIVPSELSQAPRALRPEDCPKKSRLDGSAGKSQHCVGKRGKKEGPYLLWEPSGALVEAGAYKRDKKHGMWRQWTRSRSLKMSGPYKKGKRHGEWLELDDQGGVKSVGPYKKDKRHGLWRAFEDGALIAEGVFKKGKKDGLWRYISKRFVTTTTFKDGAALSRTQEVRVPDKHARPPAP